MPRQDSLTVSLGQDAQRHKAALESLAASLGFSTISAFLRWLAETTEAAQVETAILLEAAGHIAAGGDEWAVLATVKTLLPPITLRSGGRRCYRRRKKSGRRRWKLSPSAPGAATR